jgi:putative transposase
MNNTDPLVHGNFYHIYNRGINSCDVFKEPENYQYFLKLYDEHISPIADTYAWVLMPNHFHFLLQVKDVRELTNLTGLEDLSGLKPPHQYFSNLFNAYSKAFNKRYNRHGSLFERRFKRKRIHNLEYLRNVVLYIHDNPIHHLFCENKLDYPWSSYLTMVSVKTTRLQRDTVIGWFDDKANFKYRHDKEINTEEIEKWLEI